MLFALRERAGHFQQPVGERGLAMIDVRDDTKIAYELRVHSGLLPPAVFCQLGCRRRATAPGQRSRTSLETMPCNHSVCHKSQRSAARSPGYSFREHAACLEPPVFRVPSARPRHVFSRRTLPCYILHHHIAGVLPAFVWRYIVERGRSHLALRRTWHKIF
jgi:hypothetical protein